MPWSKLDTINIAFNVLNKASVQDVVNSGVFADSASRGFDLLYPTSISGKSWRFATKTQELNVLVDPPPISFWTYQMQLPSDYLAAVRTWYPIDYQIYGDRMYTNSNTVTLEYRYLPEITACPAYFINYFSLFLASWLANAVAENDTLASKLQAMMLDALNEALFTDSQSHPSPGIINNPIIRARNGWYYGPDVVPPGVGP
jgi:hypothetical protein